MFLKQNILSAIKVMKDLKMTMKSQRASRTDFTTEISKRYLFFLEVYVIVQIRTENSEVSPGIQIEF